MASVEYIAKIKGDTSQLEKVLKQAQGNIKKLENDEVLIKLDYDGNIKEFNKVFDKVLQSCPDLNIQFQYNVNQKLLNQELNKLQQLTSLQLDIDTKQVDKKIDQMITNLGIAMSEDLDPSNIQKMIENIYRYANSARDAGAAIGKDIADALWESIEGTEYEDIFDKIVDGNPDKLKLFKISETLDKEIERAKSKVDDLKSYMEDLEIKGAKKTTEDDRIKELSDEIKILRSDIEDMREELSHVSGKAFEELTQQIEETNSTLDKTIERLEQITGEKLNFSKLEVLRDLFGEHFTEKNGKQVSDFWDLLKQKIDNGDESAKQLLKDIGLISDESDELSIVGTGMVKSGGFIGKNYSVLATKEHEGDDRYEQTVALQKKLDEAAKAGVNVARIIDVVRDKSHQFFLELQETAPGEILGDVYMQSSETGFINPDIFEATEEQINKLINDIKTLHDLGVGVDINPSNIFYDKEKGFSFIDLDLKPASYDNFQEMIDDIRMGTIEAIQIYYEDLEDSVGLDKANNFVEKFNKVADMIQNSVSQLPNIAEEATKKAQDSHSPSIIAKNLGEMWGVGYAQGILEHKEDVENAVRELVNSGKLTVQDLINDQKNISNDFHYSDIVKPVENIIKDVVRNNLSSIINKSFKTNNKTEATNQLQEAYETFKEVFDKEFTDEQYSSEIGATAAYNYYKAFEEALKKKVDPKKLKNLLIADLDEFDTINFNPNNGDISSVLEVGINNAKNQLEELHKIFNEFTIDKKVEEVTRSLKTLDDKLKYLKDIKKQSKFLETAEERKLNMEEKAWDVGGNNPKSEADSLNKINKYEDLCDQIDKANEELDSFEETYDKVIITLKNGEKIEIFDPSDLDEIELAKNKIKDIEFVTEELDDLDNRSLKELVEILAKLKNDSNTSETRLNAVKDAIVELLNIDSSKFEQFAKILLTLNSDNPLLTDGSRNVEQTVGALEKLVENSAEADLALDKLTKSSPTQTFDNDYQQDIVSLENYRNTLEEIEKLRLEPETDEAKRKLEELNKLADYYVAQITTIRSENGHEVNRSMMQFNGLWNDRLMNHYTEDQRKAFWEIAGEKAGLNRDTVTTEFSGIDDIIQRIESKSEALRQSLNESLQDSKRFVNSIQRNLLDLIDTQDELAVESNKRNIELFQQDVEKILNRYPELQKYKDLSYSQAKELIKTDEWKDFLATFPQAQEYLKALGYNFDKARQTSEESTFVLKQEGEQAEETANALKKTEKKREEIISGNQSSNQTVEEIQAQVEAYEKLRAKIQEVVEQLQNKIEPINEETRVVSNEIPKEITKFDELNQKIQEIIISITSKIEKVRLEKEEVEDAVDAELIALQKLVEQSNIEIKILPNTQLLLDELRKVLENGDFKINIAPTVNKSGKDNDISGKAKPPKGSKLPKNKNTDSVWDIDKRYIRQKDGSYSVATTYKNAKSTETRDVYGNVLSKNIKLSAAYSDQLKLQKKLWKDQKALVDEVYRLELEKTKLNSEENAEDIAVINKQQRQLKNTWKKNKSALEGSGVSKKEIDNRYDESIKAWEDKVDKARQRQAAKEKDVLNKKNKEEQARLKAEQKANIENASINNYARNLAIRKEQLDIEHKLNMAQIDGTKEAKNMTEVQQQALENRKAELKVELAQNNEERKQNTKLRNQNIQKSNQEELNKIKKEFELEEKAAKEKAKLAEQAAQQKAKELAQKKAEEEEQKRINALEKEAISNKKAQDKEAEQLGTSQNARAIKEYKELYKTASEYQKLLSKEKANTLTEREANRLAELKAEWDDATKKVNKYKKAVQSNATSSTNFDDISNQVSNSLNSGVKSIENELLKEYDTYKKIMSTASDKYTGEFLNDLNNVWEYLQKINSEGLDINTDEDRQKLGQILQLLDEFDSKASLDRFRKASEVTIEKLRIKISDFMKKNDAMGKDFMSRFENLKLELDTADSKEQILNITNAFLKLENQVTEAEKTGKSFFKTFGEHLRSINAQFLAQYFSWQDLIRYGQGVVTTIKEIDSAITELRKVSDSSSIRLQESFETSAKTAKELGSAINEVINITSDWSRLGFNVDEAEELARVTTLFKTVGDNMTTESASEAMISTIKAYGIAVNDSQRIVDQYNEIANNFAIDTAGLSESITRAGAALSAAGNELSESMGLVVAANDSLQDPSSVGQMLKTMSMRLRGASVADLEELGIDTEGMSKGTKSIVQQYKAMAGINIMEGTNYKTTYQILDELHEKWADLTDAEQAAITEATGGKRGGSVMSSLMKNWEDAKNVVEKAEASTGSAEREQENYAKSIQYSLDRLKASWQELQTDFISSTFIKDVIDLGNTGINVIDNIIKKLDSIIPVITTILGLMAANKNMGFLGNLPQTLSGYGDLLNTFKNNLINTVNNIGTSLDSITTDLATKWNLGSASGIASNIQAPEELTNLIKEVNKADGLNELVSDFNEAAKESDHFNDKLKRSYEIINGYSEVSQESINEMMDLEGNWTEAVYERIHANELTNSVLEKQEEYYSNLYDIMADYEDQEPLNLDEDLINSAINLRDQQADAVQRASDALNIETASEEQNTAAQIQNAAQTESSIATDNAATVATENKTIAEQQQITTLLQENVLRTAATTATQQETLAIIEQIAGEEGLTLAKLREIAATREQDLVEQGYTVTQARAIVQTAQLTVKQYELAAASRASMIAANLAKLAIGGLIGIVGGLVLNKVISWIDDFIHREEKMAEAAKEARNEIKNIQSTFNELKTTTNDIKRRYAELAQGVQNLGTAFQSQGNLSTDEYKEFLDLSNQLAELYPSLTQGYTDNKDAILNLSGSVDTIVGSLDKLIDRSKTLARMEIDEQMGTVWADNMNAINKAQKDLLGSQKLRYDTGEENVVRDQIKGYKETLEDYEALYKQINNSPTKNVDNLITKRIDDDLATNFAELHPELYKKFHDHVSGSKLDNPFNGSGRMNFGVLGPDGLEQLRGWLQGQIQEYSDLVQQSEDKIAQINAEMQSQLITYLSGDLAYTKLDKNEQLVVNSILSNFDMSNLPENVDTWDKLTEYYHNNIINAIGKIDNKDVQESLTKLFSGEGTYSEAQDLYKIVYNYLVDQKGFKPDDPLILYLQEELEDQGEIVSKAAAKLTNNVDKQRKASYGKFWTDWLSEQTDEFVSWVQNDLSIPDNVIYTTQELLDLYDEWISKEKEIIENNPATISQTVKQFNEELKPQFDALATAYDKVFHNEKGLQAGLESLDIAWFEDIRSNFEEIKEELGITFDSTKVDEFFNALDDGKEVTEKMAHDAFNDLATAYFYSADGLKNLNEETANSIKLMMKNMRVTNYKEVVDGLMAVQEQSDYILDFTEDLNEEYDKISEFNVTDYANEIKNQTLQSKFGNIDMDKRTIIHWSNALKETYQHELASWDYNPTVGGIDTVFGGSDVFTLDNQEIEVAFTPIMVDQNGNNPQFLDKNTVMSYIQNVLSYADQAISESGEEWSEELVIAKALEIDAQGIWTNEYDEAGKVAGTKFVHGLIGAIGQDGDISAFDVGNLLHFSGEKGAIQLIEQAMDEVAQAEEQLESEGKKLEEITQADIQRFMQMGIVTEASAERLQYYAAMKAAANNTLLNESQPISALKNLAIAAGMAEAEIEALNEVMALFDKAAGLEAAGAYTAANEVRNAAEQRQREFAKIVQDKFNEKFNLDNLEIDFPSVKDSAGAAGKEAVDAIKDQLDVLKWLYDNDVIDYKHYLDQKKVLLDRALAEGLIDEKRYFEEIHTWLRETLDLYNSVISYATKLLDKEIDRLEKERDERIKSIEEQRDAELKAIDETIKAQEEKIKLKQKEIDALQEANEKRKQELDLQKALYELERSKHQRTNLVLICQTL